MKNYNQNRFTKSYKADYIVDNKITLFLMTRKGLKILESLGQEFRELIDFVVIARDKSVQEDCYDEIQQVCKQFNIQCFDRQSKFNINSHFAIAISWRWLINLDKTQLIVFHDSLLPKYRGFNPLVSSLINGEKKIGVTALFAADEYDCGDIIMQSSSEISYPLKIRDAIEIISNNYIAVAHKILAQIRQEEQLMSKKQEESEVSYSLWRDEEDYAIDWTKTAQEIRRFIDAVGFPYLGASTLINNKLFRIFDVEEVTDVKIENRVPGKVIFMKEGFPVVVCGEGLLKILNLIVDNTNQCFLPLTRFRTRFK